MDFERFTQLSQESSVVSLSRKFLLDEETPISLLDKFREQNDLFLLEAIPDNKKHDRFSYIGFDPHAVVTAYEDHVELKYDNDQVEIRNGNMFDILKSLKNEYYSIDNNQKYYNGIIGFLTYECLQFIENVTFPDIRELDMPLARFIIPKSLIVIDNLNCSMDIVRNIFIKEDLGDLLSLYNEEYSKFKKLINIILTPTPQKSELDVSSNIDMNFEEQSNLSKDEFLEKLNKCKEYIEQGDIFQIQISRRNTFYSESEPLTIYRYLRNLNPSPFMYYIKFDTGHLIGASPELLVKIEDGKVYQRPIAGTRKRFSSSRTEKEIEYELLTDEKEIAEHIMLVDLARNDIGKVSIAGSVNVDELMSIEKYSHVIHMVSNIDGTLKPNYDAIDALKASFPAGTVTGTPKVRAMEIISEMEKVQREFYSGGIMFLDFVGNLKCALTIRSMFIKDKMIYTQAAAGIVYDSIPENEYLETENKMQACITAIKLSKVGVCV